MGRNVNIIKAEDGRKIVVINDIKFKGKRKINWDEVEAYLREFVGNSYEIIETSERVFIDKDFPDEYTGSNDTAKLMGTLAKAKANVAQGIPEMIQVSTNRTFAPNYEDKHNDDARYGWYRYDCRVALPVFDERGDIERYNCFTVRMLVRHDADGKKYLYDVLRIKKETSTPLELEAVRS